MLERNDEEFPIEGEEFILTDNPDGFEATPGSDIKLSGSEQPLPSPNPTPEGNKLVRTAGKNAKTKEDYRTYEKNKIWGRVPGLEAEEILKDSLFDSLFDESRALKEDQARKQAENDAALLREQEMEQYSGSPPSSTELTDLEGAAAQQEAARLAEEAEARRQAEETRLAEERRLAEEEARRQAEETRLAEERRLAEEEAHRQAEETRLAQEAETARQAEEQARAQALATEIENRRKLFETTFSDTNEKLANKLGSNALANLNTKGFAEQLTNQDPDSLLLKYFLKPINRLAALALKSEFSEGEKTKIKRYISLTNLLISQLETFYDAYNKVQGTLPIASVQERTKAGEFHDRYIHQVNLAYQLLGKKTDPFNPENPKLYAILNSLQKSLESKFDHDPNKPLPADQPKVLNFADYSIICDSAEAEAKFQALRTNYDLVQKRADGTPLTPEETAKLNDFVRENPDAGVKINNVRYTPALSDKQTELDLIRINYGKNRQDALDMIMSTTKEKDNVTTKVKFSGENLKRGASDKIVDVDTQESIRAAIIAVETIRAKTQKRIFLRGSIPRPLAEQIAIYCVHMGYECTNQTKHKIEVTAKNVNELRGSLSYYSLVGTDGFLPWDDNTKSLKQMFPDFPDDKIKAILKGTSSLQKMERTVEAATATVKALPVEERVFLAPRGPGGRP